MGNSQSKDNIKDFQVSINHPHFQKSKIKTVSNERFLQISQSIDEIEFNKWKYSIDKLKGKIPQNLLIPKQYEFNRGGICGNNGIIINYPYLLSQQIYNRRGMKSKFSQKDLWFLIYNLIKARRQILDIKQILGDIRPRNIFLNEKGNIKITNLLSWPSQMTNIQKYLDKTITYLSPQDLIRLQNGQIFDIPSDVSQAFSIGLSILSAANLQQYQNLYNELNFKIDLQNFNNALGIFTRNSQYSQIFRATVLLLLNINPQRRLNCIQLEDLIFKYEQYIIKKQNFIIDNAPLKLHDQIKHLRNVLQSLNSINNQKILNNNSNIKLNQQINNLYNKDQKQFIS